MIRPFTCFCAVLAGASGLYLYTEKHRTTLLDQQISQIVALTGQSQDRTAMLKAEWALLSQPDRLARLSAQFLPSLQPLAPQQFVQVADAVAHLPPKEEPKPVADPDAIAPPSDATPPAATGPDDSAGAVLASALPEKIPARDAETPDAADAPVSLAANQPQAAPQPAARAIALPAPPVRLATGRPHTQPGMVRMAEATSRSSGIIDPTAAEDTAEPEAADVPKAPADATAPADSGHHAKPPVRPVQLARVAPAHPAAEPARPLLASAARRPAAHPAPALTQVAWHPRPAATPVVRTVAWHPASAPATPPREAVAPVGFSSALGGAHTALPPPVPLGG
ncbi:hypothetical protein FHR90_001778 [Endobacter medicaginis]|uniref:Uncharacterized protein n=3 Tax=Endobacter medicaginis TaxID=1181271 RepID=A0A839UVX6_9PROT|nr:ABC transporter permease [Endobacter medicaginis]MBB3173946.1 hypothetical protein [Endobacter medicaginis]